MSSCIKNNSWNVIKNSEDRNECLQYKVLQAPSEFMHQSFHCFLAINWSFHCFLAINWLFHCFLSIVSYQSFPINWLFHCLLSIVPYQLIISLLAINHFHTTYRNVPPSNTGLHAIDCLCMVCTNIPPFTLHSIIMKSTKK